MSAPNPLQDRDGRIRATIAWCLDRSLRCHGYDKPDMADAYEQRARDIAALLSEADQLRGENARMREALEPFARDAEGIDPGWADNRRRSSLTQDKPLTVADFRRARAALHSTPSREETT